MDPDTLGERLYQNDFDLFTWGWVPFVDPDPQLYNFTKEAVNFDTEASLSNDANWCDDEYDELYIQQQQELDPDKRHDIVKQMLKIFHDRGPYAVLYRGDDLQAFRTDKWENFVRQPKDTGPVLFTNASTGVPRPPCSKMAGRWRRRQRRGSVDRHRRGRASRWSGIGLLLSRNRRGQRDPDDDDDRE